MTPEQKMLALKALSSDVALRIRSEGDWYISVPGVEIKRACTLQSLSGNGTSPFAAIEDCWNELAGKTLVVKAFGPERAEHRWNGFMWERQA